MASSLPPTFELDDLISAGYLGLMTAAERYRPRKHGGTPFTAYARLRVHGAIISSVRRGTSLAARRVDMGAGELEEMPAVPIGLEDAIDFSRTLTALAAAVAELAPVHRVIVRRHYDYGERLSAVATEWGIHRTRATQLHRDAVRALQVLLGAPGGAP